ncbi:AcrR family transcriptional regulator [Aeromicrobium sp. SORGH_AS981]|uniref:TetR/AcrR family transcriptional regulator n=1 Tax=Aeromicrobium sp. SORGH_AS_0981 TaxID=3041802 RepID=UPI00285FDEFF|nr:TetR/AcrR family transcriptional regulator [Aeromicrobium sp. SORGH_AS_0981]MDR6118864.1 AcrR family transcriptional regulator [Aeromicrobium sp. SORGH_AS_0981]
MPPTSESSPTRSRRRTPAERREEIVEAATAVVAELGYANATLTEITRRAGVSKGLLWHYFDDRDDVMQHAVTHLAGRLRAALVCDVDLGAPVPEVVRAVFARTALFTRTHQRELRALDEIVHNLRTPDGRRRITLLDYEEVHADHAALLARGQRDGTIRAGDLSTLASSYQALIDGMIAHLQAHPDVDPPTYADGVADLFLHGAALH